MDTSFEEKIIEINDQEKYYIIKQTLYNNTVYLLANHLIDDETPGEDYAILRVINKDNSLKVAVEEDEEILTQVLNIFSDNI